MAEIESYQCDFIEHEIVPASELSDFLANNTVISYELYTGQDVPEEESEEEPEEESGS